MKLQFDKWWKDFESKHYGDKSGGRYAMEDLKIEVGHFPLNYRIEFIDELISRNKILIASELIELYGNKDQKKLIRDKLNEFIDSNLESWYGDTYIRTILRTYEDSDFELVKTYYSTLRGIKVPFELFDIDKTIFLDYFEMLLKTPDDRSLYEYDGLLYLTYRLDILEYLIDNLSLIQSKRMQEFCKVKSNHSCVDSEKWRIRLLRLSNKYGS